MFIALLIMLVHVSHGPSGVVAWIQPDSHVSAGIALTHWRDLSTWLEFR
jgi:hypothetical protein